MARSIILVALLLPTACGLLDPSERASEPPAPAQSPAWPAEVKALFPRDEEGRPIVSRLDDLGHRFEVVYDETRDDPTARWGECLARVVACYRANPGESIAGCIDRIERCQDDRGGLGCCAPACVDRFQDRLSASDDEDQAVNESFVAGDCLDGFAAVEP